MALVDYLSFKVKIILLFTLTENDLVCRSIFTVCPFYIFLGLAQFPVFRGQICFWSCLKLGKRGWADPVILVLLLPPAMFVCCRAGLWCWVFLYTLPLDSFLSVGFWDDWSGLRPLCLVHAWVVIKHCGQLSGLPLLSYILFCLLH